MINKQYNNSVTLYVKKRIGIALYIKKIVKLICCFCFILNIFACSSRDKPAPVVTVYGSIPLNKQLQNTINSNEYKVQEGETLYSIAWRANSDVRQIAKLNNIPPPYNIYPNQKLILVNANQEKIVQVSKNKASSENKVKNSNEGNTKVLKKNIASSKKQAYGKNVSKKKVLQNNLPQTTFSKKIRQWQWPVNGKIISKFSAKVQGNKGIDIAGRRGTNIKATANGKVVYSGSALSGYGKLIIIKHNDDYLSAYAHNDKILVKEQQHIKAGDIIAKMGDTDAERVMLHFEVRFRGKSVDPLKYLPKK